MSPFRHFLIAVMFGLLLAACGGSAEQTNDQPAVVAEATALPRSSGFANPAVPFEGVVQIWAGYYDEAGELQIGWTGSGTIITPDGFILSNAHVVLPDRYFAVDELIVALTVNQDQEPVPSFFAEVVQADAALDLAVIQVTHDYDGNPVNHAALSLPYVSLGDADMLNLGDEITILGYPGIGGDTVTLTRGEVSGFTSQQPYGARAFIKTNATIAGGNSGGLAVDEDGYLVGVPTQLGYGGDDQFVDCRVLVDTNRDGLVNDLDNCVPTGGFINALRPVTLALPLIEAAQRGEVAILDSGTPEMVNVPQSGSYVDNFSDPNSGWDVYSYESGSAYYFGGELYLEDITGSPYYTSLLHRPYDNVEFSVDLRIVESEGADNEINLSCRYVDEDNGYEFRIFDDGWVGISMWLDGEYVNLYDPQPAVPALSGRSVRATVICDGNYLGLWLDGELVAETVDSSFSTGDVGLAVFVAVGDRFAVAVDNFEAVALGAPAGDWEVVLSDDFSSTATGWNQSNDQDFARYYSNGKYYMEVMPTESYSLSAQTRSFLDVVVNVDVNIEETSFQGDIGIICRYVDNDNYYALEVSEDGYFSIWKMVNGSYTSLVSWTTSQLIPADGEPFVLNASCNGVQLSLGINGDLLATTTDSDLLVGGVGLFVGTLDYGGLVVSFDNFEVLVPQD